MIKEVRGLKIKEGIVWCDKLFLLDAKCHELSPKKNEVNSERPRCGRYLRASLRGRKKNHKSHFPRGFILKR